LNLRPAVYSQAVLHARPEFPLCDRFHGFLVKSHAEAFHYVDVAGMAFKYRL